MATGAVAIHVDPVKRSKKKFCAKSHVASHFAKKDAFSGGSVFWKQRKQRSVKKRKKEEGSFAPPFFMCRMNFSVRRSQTRAEKKDIFCGQPCFLQQQEEEEDTVDPRYPSKSRQQEDALYQSFYYGGGGLERKKSQSW